MDKRFFQFLALLIGLSAFTMGVLRLFGELELNTVYVSSMLCAIAANRWYARADTAGQTASES